MGKYVFSFLFQNIALKVTSKTSPKYFEATQKDLNSFHDIGLFLLTLKT